MSLYCWLLSAGRGTYWDARKSLNWSARGLTSRWEMPCSYSFSNGLPIPVCDDGYSEKHTYLLKQPVNFVLNWLLDFSSHLGNADTLLELLHRLALNDIDLFVPPQTCFAASELLHLLFKDKIFICLKKLSPLLCFLFLYRLSLPSWRRFIYRLIFYSVYFALCVIKPVINF